MYKSLPHSRSQVIAIKLSSKITIQLLPTDLAVYFSIFKQCIKQHSRLIYNEYELPFDMILEDYKQKSKHQKISSH